MPRRPLAPTLATAAAALAAAVVPAAATAQPAAPRPAPQPYVVGHPLGVTPSGPGGPFEPMSANVTVFGAVHNAESCSYDAERGVIVVPNRGVSQRVLANDAFVSFIDHDGSVHTARWIGVQPPAARAALTPPLTLNDPFGSDIVGGVLYVADSDGNTRPDDPRVAVIRKFDLATGAPAGEVRVERSAWLNDLAVAPDGTIWATQTGDLAPDGDPATWQVLRVAPDGAVRLFAQGAPLRVPNGIALDPQGNVVVVNSGDSAVLTFSPDGSLLRTEAAAQAGSDGLVIMPDGTKYVSSVFQGGVSRIPPGGPAELIARNIPSAASMCYDSGANQLVIPLNDQNGLAFIRLDADVERELVELSRTKWRWMAERNVDSLAALFHEQSVFVHMGGSMSRSQELEVIRSGGIHYRHAEIQDVSVQVIGNTAILLSRIRLDAVVGGNEVTNPFIVTEVYVRQGGRWQLGSLSFTRLPGA